MAGTVKKITLWRGQIENCPGALAGVLEPWPGQLLDELPGEIGGPRRFAEEVGDRRGKLEPGAVAEENSPGSLSCRS